LSDLRHHMERIARSLSQLQPGNRSDPAFALARAAGGYVAGYGGSRDEWVGYLTDALIASGCEPGVARGTVIRGLAMGAGSPITPEDAHKPAPRARSAPRVASTPDAAAIALQRIGGHAKEQARRKESAESFWARKKIPADVVQRLGIVESNGWLEHDVERLGGLPPARRGRELAEGARRRWITEGVDTGTTLYGLSLLAGGMDDPIWLVNGESSVWAAHAAGVDAVCTAAGEGRAPSQAQVDALLTTGREVRVCFDLDATGRKGASMWIDALPGSVLYALPDVLGEGGDFGDAWVQYGGEMFDHIKPATQEQTHPANTLPAMIGADCPAMPIAVPPDYQLSGVGDVVRMVEGKEGPRPVLVSRAPIVIVSISQDVDQQGSPGEDFVRLAWPRHGSWYEHDVSRADIADSRRLVASISSLGAPVTSAEAKEAVVWLAELESSARRSLGADATIRTTRRTGWHGRAFVMYGQTIGEGPRWRRRVASGEDAAIMGLGPRGSRDVWMREIRSLIPRVPAARLAICAALAPSLLEPTGCKGFTVQFAAGTGTGKSTMLELACSVWGAPEKGGLFGTWNNTRNGIEGQLSFMWDVPVVLDDTKEIPNGDLSVVSQIVYDVTNGSGKGAMTADRTLRRRASYRTVLVTSGEIPLLEESQDGGTRGRVITMREGPFDALDAPSSERAIAANQLTAVCMGNHGHLGPAFAEALTRADWGGIAERYRGLLADAMRDAERVSPGHATAARLCKYVALLRLAGELAEPLLGVEAIDWDWFDDAMLADALDAASGSDRALLALCDVVASVLASDSLYVVGGTAQHAPPSGWTGRVEMMSGRVVALAFIPARVRELVERSGWSFAELRTAAIKRGWWVERSMRVAGRVVGCLALTDEGLSVSRASVGEEADIATRAAGDSDDGIPF